MVRVLGMLLLIWPFMGYASPCFTTLTPTATYTSQVHGLVVWSTTSPGQFDILFSNKSIHLNFTGKGFSKKLVKNPDESSIEKAGKSREASLLHQIKEGLSHRNEKILKIEELEHFGYNVARYSIPIYAGGGVRALGAKITVTRNGCRWVWETENYGVTTIKLFENHSRTYLGVVMYIMGADGYGPAVRIFRLPTQCQPE